MPPVASNAFSLFFYYYKNVLIQGNALILFCSTTRFVEL